MVHEHDSSINGLKNSKRPVTHIMKIASLQNSWLSLQLEAWDNSIL